MSQFSFFRSWRPLGGPQQPAAARSLTPQAHCFAPVTGGECKVCNTLHLNVLHLKTNELNVVYNMWYGRYDLGEWIIEYTLIDQRRRRWSSKSERGTHYGYSVNARRGEALWVSATDNTVDTTLFAWGKAKHNYSPRDMKHMIRQRRTKGKRRLINTVITKWRFAPTVITSETVDTTLFPWVITNTRGRRPWVHGKMKCVSKRSAWSWRLGPWSIKT